MKGRMKGRGEMRVGKMHWDSLGGNPRKSSKTESLEERRKRVYRDLPLSLPPSLPLSHLAYFKWFPPTVRDGSNGEGRNWAVVYRKQFCTVGIIIPIE